MVVRKITVATGQGSRRGGSVSLRGWFCLRKTDPAPTYSHVVPRGVGAPTFVCEGTLHTTRSITMKTTRSGCTAAALILLMIAGGGSSGLEAQIAIGDRLRISTPTSGAPLEGTFSSRSDGWITLSLEDGTTHRVGLDETIIVERHTREHPFLKTFLLTELFGTVGTAIVSAITYNPAPRDWLCLGPRTHGEAFAWGAAIGAIASLPVGLVLGAVRKEDRWSEVEIDPGSGFSLDRVRPIVAPGPSGLSLGATVRLGGGS